MSDIKFGRYKIQSEIGRGGLSIVYLAHDARTNRDVALRVLPREYLHDPNFRQRFEREVQIQRIHPNPPPTATEALTEPTEIQSSG